MFLQSTKCNTVEKFLIAIISFFLISPAFAEDYIYTNKDLEKYKSSSEKIEAPQKVKKKSKKGNSKGSNRSRRSTVWGLI